MPQAQPELKKVSPVVLICVFKGRKILIYAKYLDKRLFVQLNGSRKVIGVLRGYDVRPSPRHSFSLQFYWNNDTYSTLRIGFSQHRARRRGRGKGWRRESENWYGGMFFASDPSKRIIYAGQC